MQISKKVSKKRKRKIKKTNDIKNDRTLRIYYAYEQMVLYDAWKCTDFYLVYCVKDSD